MTPALDVSAASRELRLEPGATLVAVLGYSDRRSRGLHPVCAARIAAAAEAAEGAGAVVLSGWSRGRDRSEAELMLSAWTGTACPVVADSNARLTAENAAHVGALARALRPAEVRVVTSSWHRLRARLLFVAALRGSGARLSLHSAPGPWTFRLLLREAGAIALLPLQLALVRRTSR